MDPFVQSHEEILQRQISEKCAALGQSINLEIDAFLRIYRRTFDSHPVVKRRNSEDDLELWVLAAEFSANETLVAFAIVEGRLQIEVDRSRNVVCVAGSRSGSQQLPEAQFHVSINSAGKLVLRGAGRATLHDRRIRDTRDRGRSV